MARPGLRQHPKFKRLVHLLKEPIPHVLGYLECLWSVAYEHGNAVIGNEVDVELAAEWPGDPGVLCKALRDCRLLDETDDARYAVHDLFDHAPEYVQDRARKETERRKEKVCERCQGLYHSSEVHSRYCSNACRQADYRRRHEHDSVTKQDEGARNSDEPALRGVTGSYTSPSPAQPAPIPKTKEKSARQPRAVFAPPTVEEVRAYCLERGNRIDPENFVNHYTANGWRVGRSPMRDWKASVRTWEHNSREFANGHRGTVRPDRGGERGKVRGGSGDYADLPDLGKAADAPQDPPARQ